MHISKIEIENFRNFKNVAFNTNNKMVIIGENKSGKSNLVYALRLLLDDTLPDTKRYLNKNDFNFSLDKPIENGTEITISIELTNFSDDNNLLAILCDYLISKDVAKITYKFLPKSEVLEEKKQLGEELQIDDYMYYFYGGNSPTNVIYKSEFLSILRMRVLGAIRDVETDLSLWSRSPLKNLFTNNDIISQDSLAIELENIQQDISNATNKFKGTAIVKELQSHIDTYMQNVAGLNAIKTNIDIEGNNDIIDILKIVKVFSGDDSTSLHSLSQESLGLNNLLYYSLFMLAEKPYSSILAIEEPESHLHPHLQRMIFKDSMINNPLILTTHSQNLINTISDITDIIVLKSNKYLTEVNSLSNVSLSDLELKNIQRYLDVNRSEMLFAKGVILVEGIAEEYLIPQFAKFLLHKEPEQLGISVCSVNGKYFEDFVKLLNYIDIPYVIITDGDPTTTKDFNDTEFTYYDGITRGQNIINIKNNNYISNILDSYRELVPETLLGNGTPTSDYNKINKAIKILQKTLKDIFIETLNDNNIYINNNTLEIELLNNGYKELFVNIFSKYFSDKSVEKFKEHIDNNENKEIITDIQKIGKGRFAQELSVNLSESNNIPEYIKKALFKIQDLVISNE